jgi:hypothetical protein
MLLPISAGTFAKDVPGGRLKLQAHTHCCKNMVTELVGYMLPTNIAIPSGSMTDSTA